MGIGQIKHDLEQQINNINHKIKSIKDEIPEEILQFLEIRFKDLEKTLDDLDKKINESKELIDYLNEWRLSMFTVNPNTGKPICPFTCSSKIEVAHLHQENESLAMVYNDAYLVKLRELEDGITLLKGKVPINPITKIDVLFLIAEGKNNA
jgi:DNA repair exonuclease SbcCD ATPase subunit